MTVFMGDDWAEDHHDVHLMDQDGNRLASRRLPEGLEGIRRVHGVRGQPEVSCPVSGAALRVRGEVRRG